MDTDGIRYGGPDRLQNQVVGSEHGGTEGTWQNIDHSTKCGGTQSMDKPSGSIESR